MKWTINPTEDGFYWEYDPALETPDDDPALVHIRKQFNLILIRDVESIDWFELNKHDGFIWFGPLSGPPIPEELLRHHRV